MIAQRQIAISQYVPPLLTVPMADVCTPDFRSTKRFRLSDLFGLCENRRDLDQLAAVAASFLENVEDGGKHAGHVLACHFDVVAE
jgi:hypothetical protein